MIPNSLDFLQRRSSLAQAIEQLGRDAYTTSVVETPLVHFD